MTPHEALVAARALIADERNWIKGDYDREVDGRTCYCADGALLAASWRPDLTYGVYDLARRTLALHARGGEGIIYFNDHPMTTHADVLAMFDRAIEATAPEVPA
jgi:hypothetical protein